MGSAGLAAVWCRFRSIRPLSLSRPLSISRLLAALGPSLGLCLCLLLFAKQMFSRTIALARIGDRDYVVDCRF